MSLETLLEAAEFLEWNKTGKKSRATRTSKKAEKFKPSLITERKRKAAPAKQPSAKVVIPKVVSSITAGDSKKLARSAAARQQDEDEEDDEEDEERMAMRDLRRSIGSRATHNKLEKNRRAHLKECFERLRNELPSSDERRSSNLSTLRSALRLIEQLVNKQKELESEKKKMQKMKTSKQSQISQLKRELKEKGIEYNLDDWIEVHHTSTNSTSTASEVGDTLETLDEDLETSTSMARPTTSSDIQVVIKADTPKPVFIAPASNSTLTLPTTAETLQTLSQATSINNTETHAAQLHPQVVTVAKIAPGTTIPAGKVILSPKVLSTTTAVNQSTLAPQVCSEAESAPVFFSTVPTQPANIIVTSQQQAASDIVPLTVNPAPRIVRPLQQQLASNLSIAPKQLVLITTGGEAGNGQQHLATSLTPFTTPLLQQTTTQTNTPTIIPLSSLTNVQTIQAAAPKPTVIHGVLPSKKSDGTVSYMPIKFTKPAPASGSPVVASLPIASSLGSPFLGGGVTIVIPPAATTAANSTQNVQLVSNPQQAATFHIATTAAATVSPATTHP